MAEELACCRVYTVAGIRIPSCRGGMSVMRWNESLIWMICKYDTAHLQASAIRPDYRFSIFNRGCVQGFTYESPSVSIFLCVCRVSLMMR